MANIPKRPIDSRYDRSIDYEKLARLLLHDPGFDFEKFIGENFGDVIREIIENELRFSMGEHRDNHLVLKYIDECRGEEVIEPLGKDLRRTNAKK